MNVADYGGKTMITKSIKKLITLSLVLGVAKSLRAMAIQIGSTAGMPAI